MNIYLCTSVERFATHVEPLLLKKEACNNLPLGIINQLMTTGDAEQHAYLGVVEQDREVLYAFLQTGKHNIILPDIDGVDSKAVELIASFIYKEGIEFPGVIGPQHVVQPFVHKWKQLTNCKEKIHMRQCIYQLKKVKDRPLANGQLEKAATKDQPLITQWLKQFALEINEPHLYEEANTMAKKFISQRSIYLWKVDGVAVSMVNQSRKTKNGTTINAVYTPDQYKRQGYATAAVATISKQLLEQGFHFCSLYTDLDNPTSNHIYKNIGYELVGDSLVYVFYNS
ncbi:GNAT family N-acetyltransferase [Aquibacillus sediminis]|uniref:GNAT family N-acetyltransferase n=1 Tax=Aquibacillus sediminis TaxID=2574734 RepID=UPI001108C4D9|nr:GNAT family N-acetyltransferase [Aquibacillus sediminis]